MSRINEKMGLKPAGKRAMMKLPRDRAQAISLTAAQCPKCQMRGVREYVAFGKPMRLCAFCGHAWERAA